MTRNYGEQSSWIKDFVAAGDFGRNCVEWPYLKTESGYGLVFFNGKNRPAHRVALILFTGEDPTCLCACHKPVECHNRLCVNPLHLRWDTISANNRDMATDGTKSVGESHGLSKLSEIEVRKILVDGRSIVVIADEFNVSDSTVYRIKNRRNWSHVDAHPVKHDFLRKLTDESVILIRMDDRPLKLIAKEHGVSTATVSRIKNGKIWKNVRGDDQ